MFSCENITCARGGIVLFRQLGFCLQEEAVLLLKGANGSGKTSLLEILGGTLHPDEGQVLWDGQPIEGNDDFKREMMTIGHKNDVMPQQSVYENLASTAQMYGTEMLLPAALKFYDLTNFKNTPAGQLSAGWQRKVALARLIVAPCKLWLLDEPTDFLDDAAVMLTVSLIETRVKQGGIVIAASHSMSSAAAAHTLDVEDFAI